MTGYNSVLRIRNFELKIAQLGLKMSYPKYGYRDTDVVALIPKDTDSLPVYSRDAELFVGTIEQAEDWIKGVEWARTYDQLLTLSTDESRAKKEQRERNRNLMSTIKNTANSQL